MSRELLAHGEPERIAVLGDAGGSVRWIKQVAERARPDERPVVMLQLGDLSVPGFLMRHLARDLQQLHAYLLAVPGNHEDWPWAATLRPAGDGWLEDPAIPHDVRDRIRILPRGYRWTWHGRTWAAAGGAVSVDRALRLKRGKAWWPEEEMTDEDEARIIAGGPADVLVTHDVASAMDMQLFPVPAAWGWDAGDLERSRLHRERQQRIAEALRPGHMMFAHFNAPRYGVQDLGWGPVQVVSLADHDQRFSWMHLDVRTMEWEVPA
jgi:hypothetical protein